MVDDDHRGYLLELIATKLLSLDQQVQVIGMSATLPVRGHVYMRARQCTHVTPRLQNMKLVATWLDAHCYETRYRPVRIEEHLVYEGKIFATGSPSLPSSSSQLSSQGVSAGLAAPNRRIQESAHKELADPVLNAVVAIAYETAATGFGALVFAGSRGVCESDARWISRVMPEPRQLCPSIVDKRLDLLGDLRSLSTGVDPVLEETVPYGVAFHREAPRAPWANSQADDDFQM